MPVARRAGRRHARWQHVRDALSVRHASRRRRVAVICLVAFRLRSGLALDEYEEWFRRVAVPAVRAMSSVGSYRMLRVTTVLEGEARFELLELLEMSDPELFERE